MILRREFNARPPQLAGSAHTHTHTFATPSGSRSTLRDEFTCSSARPPGSDPAAQPGGSSQWQMPPATCRQAHHRRSGPRPPRDRPGASEGRASRGPMAHCYCCYHLCPPDPSAPTATQRRRRQPQHRDKQQARPTHLDCKAAPAPGFRTPCVVSAEACPQRRQPPQEANAAQRCRRPPPPTERLPPCSRPPSLTRARWRSQCPPEPAAGLAPKRKSAWAPAPPPGSPR